MKVIQEYLFASHPNLHRQLSPYAEFIIPYCILNPLCKSFHYLHIFQNNQSPFHFPNHSFILTLKERPLRIELVFN